MKSWQVSVLYTLGAEDTESRREWWETYATYDNVAEARRIGAGLMYAYMTHEWDDSIIGVRIDEVEK